MGSIYPWSNNNRIESCQSSPTDKSGHTNVYIISDSTWLGSILFKFYKSQIPRTIFSVLINTHFHVTFKTPLYFIIKNLITLAVATCKAVSLFTIQIGPNISTLWAKSKEQQASHFIGDVFTKYSLILYFLFTFRLWCKFPLWSI